MLCTDSSPRVFSFAGDGIYLFKARIKDYSWQNKYKLSCPQALSALTAVWQLRDGFSKQQAFQTDWMWGHSQGWTVVKCRRRGD